ncbi:hypothetical protein AFB00_18335 [Pseudonocardia sp. HH130630-07]|nr:hypothetical protein AFB00_18335 [Pseudonocardia sp. HH130630-07]
MAVLGEPAGGGGHALLLKIAGTTGPDLRPVTSPGDDLVTVGRYPSPAGGTVAMAPPLTERARPSNGLRPTTAGARH